MEEEDRLELRVRRAKQPQAPFLRAGVRALVRQDDPRLVGLEPQRRDDAGTGPGDAVRAEGRAPAAASGRGWHAPTAGVTTYDELPKAAKDYIGLLEKLTGVEVGCVSTGPERNETIVRAGSKLEKLLA